jgi:prepilin-type N-terminal cleavage/methylation domain-containing protein
MARSGAGSGFGPETVSTTGHDAQERNEGRRDVTRHPERGLSLSELMVVLAMMGVIFAAGGLALGSFNNVQKLKGASENIAMQLRLSREKAIATGQDQVLHFVIDSLGTDYHVHRGGIETGWELPKGISYTWATSTVRGVTMRKDGRASNSLLIIIRDDRGRRDTVSVQMSGMVST